MGEIRALPPALQGAGATLQKLSGELDAVRGQFTGGGSASGGCAPQAAGAFDDMQRAWQVELERLGGVVAGVSSALQAAAQDYIGTDSSAMPTTSSSADPLTTLLLGGTGP